MKKRRRKQNLTGSAIALVILAALVLWLSHPGWLPLGASARESMKELILDHFMIQRSGTITWGHILTALLAVCVVALAYFVCKLILSLCGRKSNRAATVTSITAGGLKYLAVIVGTVWALSILGVNTTAVLAGVGIVGLVLGFGAQSLIEDVLTGVFIIFEGKYNVGDIIVLDDFRGTVREIGVRTTTIEDAGGNLKIMNNSDIRNLQNRSQKDSYALCDISVSYETDLRRLEALAAKTMGALYEKRRELYLEKPEYLGVTSFADSGVNVRFRVLCREQDVFAAQRALNRDIKLLFDDNGVSIPFPQVVVRQPEE